MIYNLVPCVLTCYFISQGYTALHLAAIHDNEYIIELLVQTFSKFFDHQNTTIYLDVRKLYNHDSFHSNYHILKDGFILNTYTHIYV